MSKEATRPPRVGFDDVVHLVDQQSRALDERTRDQVKRANTEEDIQALRAARAPLTVRQENLHENALKIIGVAHTPETYLFHREEIERAVQNAGAIVVEGAPEISGIYEDEFLEKLRAEMHSAGVTVAGAESFIQRSIHDNRFHQFFHEIEQLAKKYQKPIIVIDPDSGAEGMRALVEAWSKQGASEGELRDRALAVQTAMSVGGLALLLGGFASLGHQLVQHVRDGGGPIEPDRRMVLGYGAATIGVGIAMSSNNFSQTMPALAYDVIDYRNVATMRGVEQLSQSRQFVGPIVFVYGAAHADAMATYARSPKILEGKFHLYEFFRNSRRPRIEEYRYEQSEGGYVWRRSMDETVR